MNKGGEESFINDQTTSTRATKCPNVYLKRGKGKRIKVSSFQRQFGIVSGTKVA